MSELQRSLTVELNVKKKTNDLTSLTQDTTKLKDGLEKVDKQSKVTLSSVDRLEKSTDKLKGGLKELASSAFLLGSAGAGIEKLVMNFIRLEGAIRGLKGLKDVLSGLQGFSKGDMLLSASRMTGLGPKALMAGASKFAMPTMVGGAAMLAAKGIISGVNAADNFMVSRGAKPYLGDGAWDRDASGRLHDWSPTKIGNQLELAAIGGGKLSKQGDIVSNDELLARQSRRAIADSERQNREVHIAEAARAAEATREDYRRGAFGLTAGLPFRGMGRQGRDIVSGRLGSSFGGELESFKLLYGRDAGAERFRALQSSLSEQGRGLGTSLGTATAGLAEADTNINRQVGVFNSKLNTKVGMVGGKENQGEALSRDRSIVDEGNKLIELEKRGIEAVKAKQAARMNELTTIRDQTRALAEMYAAEAANAQAAIRSSKQGIGAMTPLEGRITLNAIKRAKEKGFGTLTPEMRQRAAQFLPEEANRFYEGQADKLRAGGQGFDQIMKGTIEERRASEAAAKAEEFKNKQVNLQQQIDVQAVLDEEQVANLITERLLPMIKTVELTVGRIAERVKAMEETNAGAAALKANMAGGK